MFIFNNHIKPYILSKQSSLLLIAVTIGMVCFSQKQITVGLSLTGENTNASDFRLGAGATFERQITSHSFWETGFYYRTFKVQELTLVNGSLFNLRNVQEKYLSIPVLYKYESSVLNFSIGPTFDIYLGWKEMNKSSDFEQEEYKANQKFYTGLLGKISKTVPLNDRLVFEPEIRYNPLFTNHRLYYGGALTLKYKLNK